MFSSVGAVAGASRAPGEMGDTDLIVRHPTDDQPRVLGSRAHLGEARAA